MHTSNLYYHEPGARLAERLVEATFADRVFFCNSGTEATEAAIKMARRAVPERYGIVTIAGSFHGRTLGEVADRDPTYLDWIASTITRDRDLVQRARVIVTDLDSRGVERRPRVAGA